MFRWKLRTQGERLVFARTWQAIGWMMVAIVIWLTLTPYPPVPPPFLVRDKALHFIGYAGLMFWFWQAFKPHWRWPVFLVVLGVGLEFLQGLGGIRTMDPWDMVANSLGVLGGLGLCATPLGRALAMVDRLVVRLVPVH